MKFCVIGGGSIGKRHLRNLKSHYAEIELYCFRRKHDALFEKKYSCKVINTKEELIHFGIQTIIICTPTSMHMEWVNFAASNKLNIFIEKPLVSNKAQLLSINEIEFNDSVSYIGYMLRFHEQIINIKRIISKNILGEIYSAELSFGGYLPSWPYKDYKNSYISLKSLGGGVVRTISHEIDLMHYFFGDPLDVVSINKNFDILKIECEEINKSIAIYQNKLVSISLDLLSKEYRRTVDIYGNHGSLSWDWNKNIINLKVFKNDEIYSEMIEPNCRFDVNDLYVSEMNDFIGKIKSKIFKHDLDFYYAKQNMKTILKFSNEL